MVLDATANFVRGATDAAVDSTQTTVSVVDASIFPDPSTDGEYNVVIWDADNYPRPDQDPDVEILRVTAIDTTNDDLTVSRGQETTSGASHPSGSAIHLSPTAKMFGDIEQTFNDFWDATNEELTADVNTNEVQNDNYIEPQATATEGTSYTADLSAANYHKVTLTGDVSFDFSNVDATDTNSVVLHLVQDGTGGRTPSFTPTVVWDGGSAPSWSTSAGAEDVITLVHDQDGSQWLGFVGGIGMA